MCHASIAVLLLFMHKMPCALVLDFDNAGQEHAGQDRDDAMTTSNSIKVNAESGDHPGWPSFAFERFLNLS